MDKQQTKLQIFNDVKIRTAWNSEEEEWYFSVVDIVAVLTDSANPRRYWSDLKRKLTLEGSELYEKIVQLKLLSLDGKYYATDVLSTKDILRLIQSIPSPKAEPFKLWLAKVGSERLDEIADPEKGINRSLAYYRAKGYSEEWINQRLKAIETRKKLTDEWKGRGISEGKEYAILTNEMTEAWSGMTVGDYKDYKGLHKENLRDNMTDLELIINMLAEATTTRISQNEQPEGLEANKQVARKGGTAARRARENVEEAIGESIISPLNASDKKQLNTSKKE